MSAGSAYSVLKGHPLDISGQRHLLLELCVFWKGLASSTSAQVQSERKRAEQHCFGGWEGRVPDSRLLPHCTGSGIPRSTQPQLTSGTPVLVRIRCLEDTEPHVTYTYLQYTYISLFGQTGIVKVNGYWIPAYLFM